MTTGELDPLIPDPDRLRIVATLAAGISPAHLQAKEHGRTVAAGSEAGHHEPRRARPIHPRPRPAAPDGDAGGRPCHIRARTAGNPRSSAVTNGEPACRPTWVDAASWAARSLSAGSTAARQASKPSPPSPAPIRHTRARH